MESPEGTNHHLAFDAFLFVTNAEKIYWCHSGKDKHKADKAKNKDTQVSKVYFHTVWVQVINKNVQSNNCYLLRLENTIVTLH